MKRQLLIAGCSMAFLLLGAPFVYAQQTISSGGGDLASNDVKIAFTIGELAIKTHTNTSFIIEEGTQHSSSITNSVIEEDEYMLQVSTYPNPTTDYLVLKITSNDPEYTGSSWMLLDATGKALMQRSGLQAGIHRIDLPTLSTGIYFLNVWDDQQTTNTTNKIQITR